MVTITQTRPKPLTLDYNEGIKIIYQDIFKDYISSYVKKQDIIEDNM